MARWQGRDMDVPNVTVGGRGVEVARWQGRDMDVPNVTVGGRGGWHGGKAVTWMFLT